MIVCICLLTLKWYGLFSQIFQEGFHRCKILVYFLYDRFYNMVT